MPEFEIRNCAVGRTALISVDGILLDAPVCYELEKVDSSSKLPNVYPVEGKGEVVGAKCMEKGNCVNCGGR